MRCEPSTESEGADSVPNDPRLSPAPVRLLLLALLPNNESGPAPIPEPKPEPNTFILLSPELLLVSAKKSGLR